MPIFQSPSMDAQSDGRGDRGGFPEGEVTHTHTHIHTYIQKHTLLPKYKGQKYNNPSGDSE